MLYLLGLLIVSDAAEQENKAVERVPAKIDEVPHVPQITSASFVANLHRLLPNEAQHVNHDEELERRGRIAALPLQRLGQRGLHLVRAEQQDGLHLRPLAHQNEDD